MRTDGNRVAGNDIVAPRGVTGPDEHSPASEAANELALINRRRGGGPHRAFHLVSVDLDRVGAYRALSFGRLDAALTDSLTPALQQLQPVLALQVAAHVLSSTEIIVRGRFGAILTNQGHSDVHVVVAVRRQTMADSHPTTRRFTAGLGEAHAVSEILCDRSPLLIGKLTLLGAQREQTVPYVASNSLARNLTRNRGSVLHRTQHVDLESTPRSIKAPGNQQRRIAVQHAVPVLRHDRRIARNEVLSPCSFERPAPAR